MGVRKGGGGGGGEEEVKWGKGKREGKERRSTGGSRKVNVQIVFGSEKEFQLTLQLPS